MKACVNHNCCNVNMSEVHKKILKYNQDDKSKKILLLIYGNTKSMLEKIHTANNNSEKAFTSKKLMIIQYSIFTYTYMG